MTYSERQQQRIKLIGETQKACELLRKSLNDGMYKGIIEGVEVNQLGNILAKLECHALKIEIPRKLGHDVVEAEDFYEKNFRKHWEVKKK